MADLQEKQDNYNDEPVLYCAKCLSLRIRNVAGMSDSDYCDACGSTHIEECSIEEWENLYKKRYGARYLDMNFHNKK